jgi:hypothetical protein
LRATFTSSATTVKSTGSPICVIAEISSNGRRREISPTQIKKIKFYFDIIIITIENIIRQTKLLWIIIIIVIESWEKKGSMAQ